jgi:hypothetical protein
VIGDDTKQMFHITRVPWVRGFDVSFGVKVFTGAIHVADPLTMRTLSDGAVAPTMMSLTDDGAVSLMNELWLAGVRPTVEGRENQPLSAEWAAKQLEKFIDAAVYSDPRAASKATFGRASDVESDIQAGR